MSGYAETAHAERMGGIDSGGRAVSPHVLDPYLKYGFARRGALWVCEGRAGSADATGPGGAANPVALGSYPGYSFDGASSQYLALPSVPTAILGTIAKTWEGWVYRPTGAATLSPLNINRPVVAGQQGWYPYMLVAAGIYYVFGDGANAGNNKSVPVADFPPEGVWSHIAVGTSGTSFFYAMNGTVRLSTALGVSINTSAACTSVRFCSRTDVATWGTCYIGANSLSLAFLPVSVINNIYQATRHIYGA